MTVIHCEFAGCIIAAGGFDKVSEGVVIESGDADPLRSAGFSSPTRICQNASGFSLVIRAAGMPGKCLPKHRFVGGHLFASRSV